MDRFVWITGVVLGLGMLAGVALAGDRDIDGVPVERVAIDGVPVERLSVADVKRATAPVKVSTIRGTRLGDLTVSCHGSAPTCTVASSKHSRVEVVRTNLAESERANSKLTVQIKVEDTMATVSVMWEDCRACE